MDFAELNDLPIFRFTDPRRRKEFKDNLAIGVKNDIISTNYEDTSFLTFVNPISLLNGKIADIYRFETNGNIELSSSDEKVHQKVNKRFSDFLELVGKDSIAIKSMFQAVDIKLKASETAIVEKEQEIISLKSRLKVSNS